MTVLFNPNRNPNLQAPGAVNMRTMVLRNQAGVPFPFAWQQTVEQHPDMEATQKESKSGATGFAIEPQEGVLQVSLDRNHTV